MCWSTSGRALATNEFKQYLDKYVYGITEEEYAKRYGPLAVMV